jgi:uncharacterized YigZ family protein
MSDRNFLTVAKSARTTVIIKGSEFISHCARVANAGEAVEFINSIRTKHPDATHNCWAYRISPNEYRFNDDGEPGGTAGQPILQAIASMDLEEVCVVVTRYYGGVKLGAGGLARAYSGGAAAVLKEASTLLVKPRVSLTVELPFSEQSCLYRFLETHSEITFEKTEYTDTGLRINITLYMEDRSKLESALTDALRGRVKIY